MFGTLHCSSQTKEAEFVEMPDRIAVTKTESHTACDRCRAKKVQKNKNFFRCKVNKKKQNSNDPPQLHQTCSVAKQNKKKEDHKVLIMCNRSSATLMEKTARGASALARPVPLVGENKGPNNGARAEQQ